MLHLGLGLVLSLYPLFFFSFCLFLFCFGLQHKLFAPDKIIRLPQFSASHLLELKQIT